VTVAPVVVAGNGLQFNGPTLPKRPPPVPEPTHWLTVAAVTGCAPGVSALMLLVTETVQVIGCAASLLEPLHWVISVTRFVELLVNVPFPDGHGSREQVRITVVVELVMPPLIVLTTVTAQSKPVVAPPGPGPTLLHWSTVMDAATAGEGRTAIPAKENALVIMAKIIIDERRVSWLLQLNVGAVFLSWNHYLPIRRVRSDVVSGRQDTQTL